MNSAGEDDVSFPLLYHTSKFNRVPDSCCLMTAEGQGIPCLIRIQLLFTPCCLCFSQVQKHFGLLSPAGCIARLSGDGDIFMYHVSSH